MQEKSSLSPGLTVEQEFLQMIDQNEIRQLDLNFQQTSSNYNSTSRHRFLQTPKFMRFTQLGHREQYPENGDNSVQNTKNSILNDILRSNSTLQDVLKGGQDQDYQESTLGNLLTEFRMKRGT